MGKIVLGMTISLDGFINERNGSVAANTAQQFLNAGLADELHVDIMPVLLGGGLRPFENIDPESIQLERIKMIELPGGRTHLRLRFVK